MNGEAMQDDHLPEEMPTDRPSNGDPHDERSLVTAYALGELSEKERADFEESLGETSEDRLAIDELARLGKLLRKVGEETSIADCSPDLREAVLAELAHPPVEAPLRLPERFPRRRFWLPLSLAASLAIVCGTLIGLTKTNHRDRAVAQHDAIRVTSGAADGVSDLGDMTDDIAVLAETGSQPAVSNLDLYAEQSAATTSSASVAGRGGEAASDVPASLEPESRMRLARDQGGFGGRMGRADRGSSSLRNRGRFGEAGQGEPTAADDNAAITDLEGKPNGAFGMSGRLSSGAPDPSRYSFGDDASGGAAGGGQRSKLNTDGAQAGDQSNDALHEGRLLVGGRGLPEGEQGEQKAREKEAPSAGGDRNRNRAFGGSGWGLGGALEGAGEPVSGSGAGGMAGAAPRGPNFGGGQPTQPNGRSKAPGVNAIVATGVPRTMPGDSEGQRAWFFKSADLQVEVDYGGIALPNTESYAPLVENPFRKPTEHPLSTFSVDVDTASYTNVRRFFSSRALPPADAVRVEELINYFQYSYPQPEGDVPFSITTDMADCPWNAEHRLLRVGLKGRDVPANLRPASNLVFLLDVSGSMDAPNKLPLVKEAMYLLTDKLTENDRVAIVVYAGNSGLVLPPTNGTNKAAIRNAISQLVASGSTNGGQGLQMAYDTAQSQFIKGGTNRVILATDGDFNVGIVDQNDLVRLIEEKAKGGVFLSALGFGVGNLKDGTLEKLADKGNGNYAYIDTLGEARRVLAEQLSGTLVTIAKDVKLQIEFNPAQAAEYRLIGYEDRVMPHQDFHDDRKDAGEIGAGHTVTALYEIVPAVRAAGPDGERLKYQRSESLTAAADSNELATIKLRYKEPDANESRLLEQVITDRRPQQAAASSDFNFAAAVAEFGMLLRESPYRGAATYKAVLALAEQGLTNDANGYRSEFIELVRQARDISGKE